ncbi:hypothetical protein [Nocardioides sp. YIM 152315]|nr:hypothetical protein [Nocardioides sp. YIM 152315]MDF1604150.1 hypothetical protein [Nocardioides sp. YIM 152315]
MARTRRMLVGVVAVLSLVGFGGAVQAAASDSGQSASAHRWCCL